jgi:hypothetical protein
VFAGEAGARLTARVPEHDLLRTPLPDLHDIGLDDRVLHAERVEDRPPAG